MLERGDSTGRTGRSREERKKGRKKSWEKVEEEEGTSKEREV